MIDKFLYKWPDKREHFLVKYIVKFGFFDGRLFEICQLCGGINSRTHVTNECPYFKEGREKALGRIGEITGIANLRKCEDESNIGDLENWILRIYFAPFPEWSKKQMRDLVEVMKSFVSHIYMNRPKKKPEREMEVAKDDKIGRKEKASQQAKNAD
jgi:hypothetical protein